MDEAEVDEEIVKEDNYDEDNYEDDFEVECFYVIEITDNIPRNALCCFAHSLCNDAFITRPLSNVYITSYIFKTGNFLLCKCVGC